jgi:serine/threonine protein kinase
MEIRVTSDLFLQDRDNIAKLRALSWEIGRDGELVPILIMDLAEPTCPSLYDVMQNLEKWDYCRKAYLISDIVCGLSAIHAETIVHGDLKPANLLCFRRRTNGVIDQTMPLMLKLTDFGFSEDIHPDYQSDASIAAGGTAYWNAPECIPEAPDEMQSFARKRQRDLYSCGLLLWYILDSKLPLGPASGPEWEASRLSVKADKISGAVHSRYQAWFPENMRRIWNPDAQADVDRFKAELEESCLSIIFRRI